MLIKIPVVYLMKTKCMLGEQMALTLVEYSQEKFPTLLPYSAFLNKVIRFLT